MVNSERIIKAPSKEKSARRPPKLRREAVNTTRHADTQQGHADLIIVGSFSGP
jgi:hypothetical protein